MNCTALTTAPIAVECSITHTLEQSNCCTPPAPAPQMTAVRFPPPKRGQEATVSGVVRHTFRNSHTKTRILRLDLNCLLLTCLPPNAIRLTDMQTASRSHTTSHHTTPHHTTPDQTTPRDNRVSYIRDKVLSSVLTLEPEGLHLTRPPPLSSQVCQLTALSSLDRQPSRRDSLHENQF